MKYSITTTLEKIQALEYSGKRTWVIQGGTSAGKTIAILWYILDWAIRNPNKKCTVISDTLPHLRDGAMSDFLDICRETGVYEVADWSKTLNELTLPNHSVIQFRAVELMGAHGPRRDLLYVNEANSIRWSTYRELAKRTRGYRILDFNPTNEFWAHTELVNNTQRNSDTAFIKVTYLDNECLDDDTVADIEVERGDGTNNWWRVYGLGEVGSLEGNIYSGWIPMEATEIQKRGKLVRYGLDFGFSNDQTGMLAIYQMEEENAIGVIELLYRTNIRGSQYGGVLREIGIDPSELIVGDGARPEIIADIKEGGFRCIAANKNAGSVLRGIDRVASKKIYYCGKNLEREYLTYQWRKKKSTGETLDEPQDGNDHLMDALRYAIDDLERPKFDF